MLIVDGKYAQIGTEMVGRHIYVPKFLKNPLGLCFCGESCVLVIRMYKSKDGSGRMVIVSRDFAFFAFERT